MPPRCIRYNLASENMISDLSLKNLVWQVEAWIKPTLQYKAQTATKLYLSQILSTS